jgi:tetratricopeptide (TPR) repeat protein
MISSLEEYIRLIKSKLNRNMFSPLFVRLANLYFLNREYEECIIVCRTGLEIYPDYLTAKIILLKAFLKLEYINEAENLLFEIEDKIANLEIFKNLNESLNELKNVSRQERIYYPQKRKEIIGYKNYEEQFNNIINKKTKIDFQELSLNLDNDERELIINEREFKKFLEDFNRAKIDFITKKDITSQRESRIAMQSKEVNISFASDIKIVTETLADIYAKQGHFKEAFNAYNTLLRTDTPYKERILKKLSELESNYISPIIN